MIKKILITLEYILCYQKKKKRNNDIVMLLYNKVVYRHHTKFRMYYIEVFKKTFEDFMIITNRLHHLHSLLWKLLKDASIL